MKPSRLLQTAIMPALGELDAMGIPSNPQAARLILAIAIQETGLAHRQQVSASGAETGPAVSFWQGEITGGLIDMLNRPKTKARMTDLCVTYNVKPDAKSLWEAIKYQDILAAAAARLLIFTLPYALPVDEDDAWSQYIAAWRPGKPHRERWGPSWKAASEALGLRP